MGCLKFFSFYKNELAARKTRISAIPHPDIIEEIIIGPDKDYEANTTFFMKVKLLRGSYFYEDGATRESLLDRAKWITSDRKCKPPLSLTPRKHHQQKVNQRQIEMLRTVAQRDNEKFKEFQAGNISERKMSSHHPMRPRPTRTHLTKRELSVIIFKERQEAKRLLNELGSAGFCEHQSQINKESSNNKPIQQSPKPMAVYRKSNQTVRPNPPVPRPVNVPEGVLNLLSPEEELYRPLMPMPRPTDAGYENLPPPESEANEVDEDGNPIYTRNAPTMFEQETVDSFLNSLEEERLNSQLSEEEKPERIQSLQTPPNVPNPRK